MNMCFRLPNITATKIIYCKFVEKVLNPDNKVSFASISTNDINDSTPLNIDIKIALAATNDTSGKNPTFSFIIRGDGFEFDSSIK